MIVMKKIFYTGFVGFILFEIANVYYLMPAPGSQTIHSLNIAYFLYSWRIWIRLFLGLMVVFGLQKAFSASKWLPIAAILNILGTFYTTNYEMAADTMFYQPSILQLKDTYNNVITTDKLVLGVAHNGQAKAYPIQFLGYHHQVQDSIGGKPVMITYCTVCRTGRVFEPIVNGKIETFRLVGMDHFNALFEDKTTQSWWRQATGEAVAGKLKGHQLKEFSFTQMTLNQWVTLHPNTLIMQPDTKFQVEYDSMRTYEKGRFVGKLTRRDTGSWQPKSWIIGVTVGKTSKAYDWNRLQQERIIYDTVDNQPIMILLSTDNNSFIALERARNEQSFILKNDTLISQHYRYNFLGISENQQLPNLKTIPAYQEYWHSWQTFHPLTQR
jgi:Protein of unknown function (DUF3179)